MQIRASDKSENFLIDGYGDGGFRVATNRYEGSVLVYGGGVYPWPVESVADLTSGAVAPFVDILEDQNIEILLIGSGAKFALLPQDVRTWAKEVGVAVDIMDTGAAARTYNVLRMENRLVAAALIAV